MKIKRGDMYYADLPLGVGSEQYGDRPVLIVQNNAGNNHSNTVIAATITSRTETKTSIPTHCPIKKQQGLGWDSLVLLEQIQTIDKKRLTEYIGTLDDETMRAVDKALAVSVGLKHRGGGQQYGKNPSKHRNHKPRPKLKQRNNL